MLNGSFTRWFLLWFVAAVLLLCISLGIRVAAATGDAGGQHIGVPADPIGRDLATPY